MRSFRSLLLISAGFVAVVAAPGQGQAQDRGAFMRLGETAAAPMGFLAMCENSPQDCLRSRAGPEALAEVRAWAGQTRWTRVFAEAGIHVTAQTAPDLTPRTPSSSTSAEVGAAIREARAEAKRAARKAAAQRPARPKAQEKPRPVDAVLAAAPVVATPSPRAAPFESAVSNAAAVALAASAVKVSHRDLETVNRRINRAIRPSSDEAAYGQADVWVVPSGPRARGDCEDYALAKRRALIEMGVNPEHLSLAVVRTRSGEIHAVLLAETQDGEFVLDNLSPWVVRWDSAPYEWLERQAPGSGLDWVRLETTSA